jgi:hypothetical protein
MRPYIVFVYSILSRVSEGGSLESAKSGASPRDLIPTYQACLGVFAKRIEYSPFIIQRRTSRLLYKTCL